jgi:hypothetical protein
MEQYQREIDAAEKAKALLSQPNFKDIVSKSVGF